MASYETWRADPRMRAKIVAHLDAGGAGLDPAVKDAITALKNQ